MQTEQHQIEIPAVIGLNKLTLRQDATAEVIGVRITTPEYNVAAIVLPEQLLLAVRTLCGELSPPEPLQHTAKLQRVLGEVAAERARQNTLHEAGTIPFNCADANVPLPLKVAVLTEEFLESIRECNAHAAAGHPHERHTCKLRLRGELIQLAAVAVAVVESLPES